MSTDSVRNTGDPVRRAAAQARRAAEAAERDAADGATFTSCDDVRPADLPPQDECDRIRNDAYLALEAARAEVDRAVRAAKDAAAYGAERHHLAALAFTGNVEAQERLTRQVRASHPAITGFTPVPGVNDAREHFNEDLKDLGLMVDVPTTGVDEAYFASLAEAMRAFVRWYGPKINSSTRRVGNQGHAYAETRVGRILYHPHPKRPAYFQHTHDTSPGVAPLADATYPTLEQALAALPALLTVGVLAGRTNPRFTTLG